MRLAVPGLLVFVAASLLLVCPSNAWADAPAACASQDALDANAKPMLVDGFPGQAIHLHTAHPEACSEGAAGQCTSKSWLVAGDQVLAGDNCDGWTLVKFVGRKTTIGWIPSGSLYAPPMQEPLLDPNGKDVDPVCATALKQLNAKAIPFFKTSPFESAVRSAPAIDKLPDRGDFSSDVPAGYASIEGRLLGVSHVMSEGTCYDDSVELWDRGFKNQVASINELISATNDDQNPDPADWAGYSWESLDLADGKPYFVHFSRGAHYIKMYGFAPDMSTPLVCEFASTLRRPEALRKTKDPDVCEAAVAGKVEPIAFEQSNDSGSTECDGRGTCSISKPQRVDLHNDGTPLAVAMFSHSDESSAGCGTDYNWDVPVVIGVDGKPKGDPQPHQEEGDSEGRLFRYHGTVYFESHSLGWAWNDGSVEHAIWKTGASSDTKVCDFNPVQYVLIKPRPTVPDTKTVP